MLTFFSLLYLGLFLDVITKVGMLSRQETLSFLLSMLGFFIYIRKMCIDFFFSDIIHGKLDQKNGILELDHAIGRDIKSEDLPNIVATLQVSHNYSIL